MQMQGEILAKILNTRNHWWPIVDFQCDTSPDNILLGMWRLSTKMIDCMRSIEISWNWSAAVSIQGRLRERQCGLFFLFQGKSKSENLVREEGSDVDRKLGLLLILLNIAAQPGSATRRLHQDRTGSYYGVMIFLFMILLFFSAFSSYLLGTFDLFGTDPYQGLGLFTWITWGVAPFHHNCSC